MRPFFQNKKTPAFVWGKGNPLSPNPLSCMRAKTRTWDALAQGFALASGPAILSGAQNSNPTRDARPCVPSYEKHKGLGKCRGLCVFGRGRIRTHEPLRASCFQDRRNRPLCHSSRYELVLKILFFEITPKIKFKRIERKSSRKLCEKTEIVFCEKADVWNIKMEHSEPLDPHSPCVS